MQFELAVSVEYDKIGLSIPAELAHKISNLEKEWHYMKRYWEAVTLALQKVKRQLSSYFSLAKQLEGFYGVNLVWQDYDTLFNSLT